ncbi:hypothetical protein WMY93_003164 [Mugilogobius chulae]|uniref:Uncharacterized protein n=1 Tax=Mugilogobius chulae TaxID=88201 RepID=A0AAW0PXH5_9GOBI
MEVEIEAPSFDISPESDEETTSLNVIIHDTIQELLKESASQEDSPHTALNDPAETALESHVDDGTNLEKLKAYTNAEMDAIDRKKRNEHARAKVTSKI